MAISIRHSHALPAPRRPRGLLQKIRQMLAIARQREDLSRLPDHILDDIGITAAQARAEAARAPWDVPSHWRS